MRVRVERVTVWAGIDGHCCIERSHVILTVRSSVQRSRRVLGGPPRGSGRVDGSSRKAS